VRSARKRLVLTYPRLDAALERPRIPSHYLLRVMEALTGETADYERLEKFVRARGRFVQLTRFDAARRSDAVTALEYDLAAFAAAEREGMPEALRYLENETAFFTAAVKSETARWEGHTYTEYDGRIPSEALPPGIVYDDARGTSASRLERYAACPFGYLMQFVLGLEPVEEPERAVGLSALDRGTLMHNILFDFFSGLGREKRLPPKESDWPRLEAAALKRFERFEREGVTGYPLPWSIAKRSMLEELREFLSREQKAREGFVPAWFELRFGASRHEAVESDKSSDAPAVLRLPDGSEARFSGRIDRVDWDRNRKLCRILDYKTGRPKDGLKNDSLLGGRALQLPVYLLAAQKLFPDLTVESAAYYHIGAVGKWKQITFGGEPWEEKAKLLGEAVATLLEGIRSGCFMPRPEPGTCEYCDYRLTCGHGRFIDYKWEADPVTLPLRRLEGLP